MTFIGDHEMEETSPPIFNQPLSMRPKIIWLAYQHLNFQ
jgi:hypothetical protein